MLLIVCWKMTEMHTETESPDRNNKNAQFCVWPLTWSVSGFDCCFPEVLSKEQPILSFCM